MTAPPGGRALVLRYAAFAVLATLANLGTQRLVLAAEAAPSGAATATAGGFALAVLAGTAVGLVVKYLLDKRWIFADRSTGLGAHAGRFSLYTLTGVGTTLLFWATETAFWLAWQTELAREAGAVLGLALGYTLKYRLDRRFVFRPAAVAAGTAA